MTVTFRPGDSFAHRLDPRSKLAFQFTFAATAFTHSSPETFAVLTAVAMGALAAARTSPVDALYGFRYALPFLALAPIVRALTFGPPWITPEAATPTVIASYRVLLVLFVAAAYVHSTPTRDSRAAIQRTIPGRTGQFLGMGVAFVFRSLPLLQDDLARIRDASAARLGTERPLRERMAVVAGTGLSRAFERADHLTIALQARCFSWNPTLPPLAFTARDIPVFAAAAALATASIV